MGLTTTFVGVDQDAYGNGDNATLPIDTWLQRRLQYNVEECLNGYTPFCWSPYSGSSDDLTTFAGIRPYASLEKYVIWRGIVPVVKDQTAVNVTLVYHVEAVGKTGSSAGTVKIRIQGGGQNSAWTDLTNTYSTGTKTGHITITHSFAERQEADGEIQITIWAVNASTVAQTTTIGSAGATSVLYHESPYRLRDSALTGAPGYFDPNSSATPPAVDSRECLYIKQTTAHPTTANNAKAPQYDLIAAGDNGTRGTTGITVQPVVEAAASVASSVTAYVHECLMLRAVMFEPIVGSESIRYPASAVTSPRYYAPNQQFGSAEAMRMADLVQRAYRQPYTALVGPKGRATSLTANDLRSFASNGYAVHWPYVMGDYDASPSREDEQTYLVNDSLYLRTENPRLEIICRWVSVQHGAPFGINQTTLADKDAQSDKARSNERYYKGESGEALFSSAAGSATWDLTFDLQQINDATSGTGDWDTDSTSYGSETDTARPIRVFGSDLGSMSLATPPVCRGLAADEQMSKSDSTDPGFWFKEGCLFRADFDAQVVQETRHEILVSGTTQTQTNLPFRLRITAALNTFTDKLNFDGGDDDLRLMLVSYTVIEHPHG